MADNKTGCEGSMQGQIKTPMNSTNVENDGDPKTHSYKGVADTSGKDGKTDIQGPGAQGKWTPGTSISGNNTGNY